MQRRDLVSLLGAMATWPLAARAQQKVMPVIGYLGASTPGQSAPSLAAFRHGLSETDYVEGQKVAIEYRWAEGRLDRMPAFAADLVARKVDVIVAGADIAAQAAKNATSTIPIVFIAGNDPVSQGLVANMARPGGNLTGVSFLTMALNPQRFELLRELVPQARVIALLVNPDNRVFELIVKDLEQAARANGVQLHVLKASIESEIDAAFTS